MTNDIDRLSYDLVMIGIILLGCRKKRDIIILVVPNLKIVFMELLH